MAQLLVKSGYKSVTDPDQANVLIVNTCGFIAIAKEESRNVLTELAAKKKSGQILIAAGCLTQRYGADVARDVPGIDGSSDPPLDGYCSRVTGLQRVNPPGPRYQLPETATAGSDEQDALRSQCRAPVLI